MRVQFMKEFNELPYIFQFMAKFFFDKVERFFFCGLFYNSVQTVSEDKHK